MSYYKRRSRTPYKTKVVPSVEVAEGELIRYKQDIEKLTEYDAAYRKWRSIEAQLSRKFSEEKNELLSNINNNELFLGFIRRGLNGLGTQKLSALESSHHEKRKQSYLEIWGIEPKDESFLEPSRPFSRLINEHGLKNGVSFLETQIKEAKELEEYKKEKKADIESKLKSNEKRRKAEQEKASAKLQNEYAALDAKLGRYKARTVRKTKDARRLADSLKDSVYKTSSCPYCTQKIEDSGHLDHIYPLSKGGLSVESNLVFVCSACNLKKSDMTLNQFIRKHSLDRVRIEKVLYDLGKDF